MRIHDISVPIAPGLTPTYPGDPAIEIESWAAIERGDDANVTALHFGAHTATHIDAPSHFIQGAPDLQDIPLDALMGEASVVVIPSDVLAIDESHIETLRLEGAERVLFKTRNSEFWGEPNGRFREDFTHILPEAARALVALGVRLVGFDYLSVEEFGSRGFETHLALLSRNIVIVEGLDLRGVSAGTYEFVCLPLKIAAGSGDGAPARAVLRSRDRRF